MPVLTVEPSAIEFRDVVVQRASKESVTVTNTLSSPVAVSLRTSAPGRLSVSPAEVSLEAGESTTIAVKLVVPNQQGKPRANGQRDTIFFQSTYFQQKVGSKGGI